ncbi:hypothetical protein N7456_002046 [Penicillium angulare]|uniref:Survival Motor Neuron Gemin2-binding domain-containing protein n=1 Tax=Penicillium angulare TaxID=116970 RepID=A0A9W9G8R2_9EURO|nr:hypothetical protein N7456_002046 [Penicillium angulare]
MGKSKHEKPLSHEEIWDDSALVRSWEDAVEEYQLYHSIHAKGENVEDVLREAEESGILEEDPEAVGGDEEAYDENVTMEGDTADSNIPVTDPKDSVDQSTTEDIQQPIKEEPKPAASQESKIPPGAMPMPEPIMAQVQDENLKRLMMSWYYAGYYTGLYEGQQQGNQSNGSEGQIWLA